MTTTTPTTTYTVTRPDGDLIDRHLSAYDAMDEILSYDSYRWEVRADDPDSESDETRYYVLYSSDRSTAAPGGHQMVPTDIAVWATSEAEAMPVIASAVIRECSGWQSSPDAYTDADYDEMIAQATEDDQADTTHPGWTLAICDDGMYGCVPDGDYVGLAASLHEWLLTDHQRGEVSPDAIETALREGGSRVTLTLPSEHDDAHVAEIEIHTGCTLYRTVDDMRAAGADEVWTDTDRGALPDGYGAAGSPRSETA